jgi:hypothetical protein
MKLKIARTELTAKPKLITLENIENNLNGIKETILYFDKENSHKDLVELVEYFEEKEMSVYFREVKYGLGDDDYMYEVHLIK